MKKLFAVIVLLTAFLLPLLPAHGATILRTLPTLTSTPVPTIEFRKITNITPSITPEIAETRKIRITVIPTPTTITSERNIKILISPTPVKTDPEYPVIGKSLEHEVKNIGQETWLNPQPEPPLYDSLLAKKSAASGTFTWPNLNTMETIQSNVTYKPEGAFVTIPNKLIKSTGSVNLLIRPDFKISGQKTILFNGRKEIIVKSPPTAVYQKINTILSKDNIKLFDDFTLDLIEGKAVYSVTVEEPVKLLGIIPLKMKSRLLINDRDQKSSLTKKPWFSTISKQNIDYIHNLDMRPNLVVKNLKYTPTQYQAGQEVHLSATIVNDGLGYAFGFPSFLIENGSGGPTAKLILPDQNNAIYSWYPILINLGPGEEWVFDYFKVSNAECGLNLRIEIANNDNNQLEETSKDDNVISGKMECQ